MTGKDAHQDIPWAELPVVLALAHENTLSGAGRRLGIDRTTVARRIDALETKIGRRLFERDNGQFELTLVGRKAFAAAERAHQELSFFGDLQGRERFPLGKVRLSLPAHMSLTLAEPLTRFQQQNPEVMLELTATDRQESLVHHETDVAIRLSPEPPKGMTKYKLGSVPLRLYQKAGDVPDSTRYISFPGAESISQAIKNILPKAQIVLSVDGYVAMREYIARGAGIGVLPSDLGDRDDRLSAVSGRLFDDDLPIWLICLPEQRRLHRIQVLMSFLRAEFATR